MKIYSFRKISGGGWGLGCTGMFCGILWEGYAVSMGVMMGVFRRGGI